MQAVALPRTPSQCPKQEFCAVLGSLAPCSRLLMHELENCPAEKSVSWSWCDPAPPGQSDAGTLPLWHVRV